MRKVIFLTDFQGRETNERYFLAGQEAEFTNDAAERLVVDGRAEYAAPEQPKPTRVTKRSKASE